MNKEAKKDIKAIYNVFKEFTKLISEDCSYELLYSRDIAQIAIELTKIYDGNYYFEEETETNDNYRN